jgi:hypothetical protein
MLKSQFITFPALAQFSFELNQFVRMLGERLEDPYWINFVRPLKRFRFDLCAAPWPAEAIQLRTLERYNLAIKHLDCINQMYPELNEPSQSLLASLEVVSHCDYDPVLKGLQTIADDFFARGNIGESVAILITESRLVSLAREAIATAPDFSYWPVLVPQNLRGTDTYDHLIVIGSPTWYRRFNYVFSAPRSPAVHVLCYDWMYVRWKPEQALANPTKGSSRTQLIAINHTSVGFDSSDDEILPPEADVNAVIQKAKKESDGYEEYESVKARLLVLEADKGVFIEAEGDAKVLVIDLNEDIDNRVRRHTFRDIDHDMYILLRTAGSGNYVVPAADNILGRRSEKLREMQQTWKARLRLAVRQDGIYETVSNLRHHGSAIANQQNLRNWMNDRNIATNSRADFHAIMIFTGLEVREQEYWDAMKEIRRAHQRAGQQIRRQLVQQVNKCDLAELERLGFMDFALEGKDAGNLTAYRIKRIVREEVEVHPRQIDNPFKLEDM